MCLAGMMRVLAIGPLQGPSPKTQFNPSIPCHSLHSMITMRINLSRLLSVNLFTIQAISGIARVVDYVSNLMVRVRTILRILRFLTPFSRIRINSSGKDYQSTSKVASKPVTIRVPRVISLLKSSYQPRCHKV